MEVLLSPWIKHNIVYSFHFFVLFTISWEEGNFNQDILGKNRHVFCLRACYHFVEITLANHILNSIFICLAAVEIRSFRLFIEYNLAINYLKLINFCTKTIQDFFFTFLLISWWNMKSLSFHELTNFLNRRGNHQHRTELNLTQNLHDLARIQVIINFGKRLSSLKSHKKSKHIVVSWVHPIKKQCSIFILIESFILHSIATELPLQIRS